MSDRAAARRVRRVLQLLRVLQRGYYTVDELAEAARNETQRRDEIDRLRRTYQRAMRRLIAIVIAFIAGLIVLAPTVVEPYAALVGQLWLILGAGTLVMAAMPWLPPAKPANVAVVSLDNCNGCARCFEDCPFSAITMQPRTDGTNYDLEAVVNDKNCMSCGI